MIKEADLDKDGKVNLAEFIKCMEKAAGEQEYDDAYAGLAKDPNTGEVITHGGKAVRYKLILTSMSCGMHPRTPTLVNVKCLFI